MAKETGAAPEAKQTRRASSKKPAEQKPPEPQALVEDLGREADPAVHAGVCEAQGWRPGRLLTEREYRAAVTAWQEMRIDGQAT